MIRADVVRALFDYDESTGVFTAKVRRAVRVKAGQVVGSRNRSGYLTTSIAGKNRYLHRLAWLIVYGVLPDGEIDHINGNKADNRLKNLRVVSPSENNKNAKMPSDNKSGVIGVHWDAAREKWAVEIRSSNNKYRLGRYSDFDQAVAVRKSAEMRLGFHENHGRAK